MPKLKVTVGHKTLREDLGDNLKAEFPDVEFQLATSNGDRLNAAPDADVICGWPSS